MEFLQEIFDETQFYGYNETTRRVHKWFSRHIDDYFELIDFFELYSRSNEFNELIYFGIKFNNPYLAARVVGQNGQVIRFIRQITGTEIISPQYHLNNGMTNNTRRPSQCSRQSFLIISRNSFCIRYSTMLIIATGMYFLQQFRNLVTPKNGEISCRLPVPSKLLPLILQKKAMKILQIQWASDVRIVSPKPYCVPCEFYIIGEQVNVSIAMKLLVEYIDSIQQAKY
ncbi:hypothetical protein DERF_009101 [Dermatophagoides farinae]|uniref:K Homology domain-containing protein n=1 Tax=Dermatophagoides farinae TaxID=6954 RepID=A0A922L0E5_DERFA|nr:hypothetical protein DERF_009101 [Dermatophagoides farinae]